MLAFPWFMLVLGFLAGWLWELIVDVVAIRPFRLKAKAGAARVDDYDRASALANDQKKISEDLREKLAAQRDEYEGKIAQLREELDYARHLATQRVVAEASGIEVEEVEEIVEVPEVIEKTYAKAVTRDPLQKIAGVGPMFEKLFWSAGVYRYSQIASLSETQIKDIINPEPWQRIDPALWIRDAARLTGD